MQTGRRHPRPGRRMPAGPRARRRAGRAVRVPAGARHPQPGSRVRAALAGPARRGRPPTTRRWRGTSRRAWSPSARSTRTTSSRGTSPGSDAGPPDVGNLTRKVLQRVSEGVGAEEAARGDLAHPRAGGLGRQRLRDVLRAARRGVREPRRRADRLAPAAVGADALRRPLPDGHAWPSPWRWRALVRGDPPAAGGARGRRRRPARWRAARSSSSWSRRSASPAPWMVPTRGSACTRPASGFRPWSGAARSRTSCVGSSAWAATPTRTPRWRGPRSGAAVGAGALPAAWLSRLADRSEHRSGSGRPGRARPGRWRLR